MVASCERGNELSDSINDEDSLHKVGDYYFLKKYSLVHEIILFFNNTKPKVGLFR
jgi:hypothetical protein